MVLSTLEPRAYTGSQAERKEMVRRIADGVVVETSIT
jgi:hypothetical protein